jgi:TonB family protein
MNRMQKKCFIASTGLHLLLVVILLIGPAFLSSNSKMVDVPVLTFVPVMTTDRNVQGGGSPKGGPPPAGVPAPLPPAQPPPVAKSEPAPRVEPPKPVRQEPDKEEVSVEPSTKPAPRKPNVNTKLVSRTDTSSTSKARAEANAKAAEDRRRLASAYNNAASGIQNGTSGSTTIEIQGPGGGGLPYANWLAAVKKCYTDAWVLSDSIDDDSATATASITIARDGTVLSASLVRRSGNGTVDQTVQRALDRVRRAPALPADSNDSQRSVKINFNVKAKLLG